MEHKKYQKVYDRIDKYNLEKIKTSGKWVATEKVHGSNFSIYFDIAKDNQKEQIRFSKRSTFLQNNDWFYNYQLIKPKLEKGVKQISELLGNKSIIVYGELFGGWYPDPKLWKGAQNGPNKRIDEKGLCLLKQEDRAIQEGIYYSPNIEYMIFDIAVVTDNNLQFVNYMDLIDTVKQTELFYGHPLKIGSYNELLNYNIEFDSMIPSQLRLPKLPKGTNIAEGIVIKPLDATFVKDKKGKDRRCLIKIKNKDFLEVNSTFNMEKTGKSYKFVLLNLINQNRFNAVISKIGRLTKDNKTIVLKEYTEDVWTDFYQNHPNVQITNYNEAYQFVTKQSERLIDMNMPKLHFK